MFSKLNKFFSSIKLAIFLFISIAVISMAGTFISQSGTMAQYKVVYGAKAFAVLYWLGFLNVYDSWYFVGLTILLLINLSVASINAFPRTAKAVFGPFPSFNKIMDKKGDKFAYKSFESKKKESDIISVLKGKFGTLLNESSVHESNAKELYYSRNSIFRFSPYIAHLSIIVIIIGVLLTVKYGFRSYTNIKVGEKTNISYLLKSNKAIKLPFTIRLDKYETKYYKDGRPKAYISKVTIINKAHVAVFTKDIMVNHPLTYDGLTIYQTSYGHYKPNALKFLILNLKNKGHKKAVAVQRGKFYNLKSYNISFKLFSVRNPKKHEIPFYIVVYNGTNNKYLQKLKFNFLVVKHSNHAVPLVFAKYKNVVFFYDGMKTYYYSGVEITKNSYTSVVWVGSIMLIIALFFSFFFNHEETWVRLTPRKDESGTDVAIISAPRKRFSSFYAKFDRKMSSIKNSLK